MIWQKHYHKDCLFRTYLFWYHYP